MSLTNPEYDKHGIKRPLKKSKVGMEIEMHIMDEYGKISNDALEVIKDVKKIDDKIPIVKELGKNMIEFGCFPNVNTISPSIDMVNSIEITNEVLEKRGLKFYPFSTYPGKFTPVLNSKPKYDIQRKMYGEKYAMYTKFTGFHHHYTLPKGVFDSSTNSLRMFKNSKLKRSLINSYNFEIALDPILTLFTQSSPFYDGKVFAKDSRIIIVRGGKKLKYKNSLFSGKFRTLGNLQSYVHTQTDLLKSLKNKQLKMKRLIHEVDKSAKIENLYPHPLDISWNAVKINKLGTLEQRGMDVNLPSVLFGISAMIKYSLRKIQREYIEVIPSDNGLDEAFKVDRGIMYIPPYSTTLNAQKISAYSGFANREMYKYAKKFLNFSKKIITKKYKQLFQPMDEMIDEKKSTSDKILAYAKRKGFIIEKNINASDAKELALYSNQLFEKDLQKIKKKLNYISNL